MLEERIIRDEDRIQVLEKELEVTILFGEEADRKYEEVGLGLYESGGDISIYWNLNILL